MRFDYAGRNHTTLPARHVLGVEQHLLADPQGTGHRCAVRDSELTTREQPRCTPIG